MAKLLCCFLVIATLLTGAWCIAQSTPAPIEPLPDRIADAEFWRIFTSFSEPGGVFQDENYVSNESRYQEVIPNLKNSVEPGAIYIGVGPEQNFTYIAAFRPGVSFIIDIRRQKVHRVFSEAGLSIDYTYKQNGSSANATYATLITRTDGKGENRSFLASEANFQLVQDLQWRNLIIPIVGDFAGPKALRSIGEYAREHGTTLGVFYMSNVEQYLFDAMVWKAFYSSVSALPINSASESIRTVAPSTARNCFPAGSRPSPYWASLQSPMDKLIRAYRESRIQNNCDVVKMSS